MWKAKAALELGVVLPTCPVCHRPVLPPKRRFCSQECCRRWFRYKERLKRRAKRDLKHPDYTRYMARLNALRAKEGREPYWNTVEGRPFTKEERALIRGGVGNSAASLRPSGVLDQRSPTNQAGQRSSSDCVHRKRGRYWTRRGGKLCEVIKCEECGVWIEVLPLLGSG